MMETAVLVRGRRVRIEPLAHGDRATVLRVFEAMSPQARFYRYLGPKVRLSDRELAMLAQPDGIRHLAVVAWEGDRPVGIGRVVADGGGAELAVEVVDDLRGEGLGLILTRRVLAAAACAGIGEVEVVVHPDNRPARRLFCRLGASLCLRDGLVEGRLPTSARRPRAA